MESVAPLPRQIAKPIVSNLDKRVQTLEPQLEEVRESVEPVGDLAERIPGSRGRRR